MNANSGCQFCNAVSKANGEDPIGSATPYDRWLVIEMAPPWLERHASEHPIAAPVMEAIETAQNRQGIRVRFLAIAPDRDYSDPRATRVLYCQRPSRLFAQYDRQEFLVPHDRVVELANALLLYPDRVAQFQAYRQPTDSIRDLAVCIHGNVDTACARFGYPIYKQLRADYAPLVGGGLRVWRCSHFGGHRFAPTLVDLPGCRYWGHLESDKLEALVWRRGEVAQLRQCYRGWAGWSARSLGCPSRCKRSKASNVNSRDLVTKPLP